MLLDGGFEEGIRGEQIRLDRALGTTTPDVIYRSPHHADDEGVAIYMDGLSGHIHGNPATAARDREIRSWLRNSGYEVIEIPASELYDGNAMTRHFRRLAGYIGDYELRSALGDDSSWFTSETADGSKEQENPLQLVSQPSESDQYSTCVPLIPLKVAAGYFGAAEAASEDDDWEWVSITASRTLRPGMFVAKVTGKSMEPRIPDGAYCLFASDVTGSRQGKTVLVSHHDIKDPETDASFTVKRYESTKVEADDDTWRHTQITLTPDNPAFEPISVRVDDDAELQVIAELIEVLP